MKERKLYPQKADEVIKELTNANSYEIDQFAKHYPEEIFKFSESFSAAFKGYLELKHFAEKNITKDKPISQVDYINFFCYQIFDNLFTSFKILLMGFQTASGNLMRQVAEGVAIVILCANTFNIKRTEKKGKKINTKEFYYYNAFKEGKSYAKAHRAIQLLDENKDTIGISDYGIEILKLLKEQNNANSHPNMWSTSAFISIGKPGKM